MVCSQCKNMPVRLERQSPFPQQMVKNYTTMLRIISRIVHVIKNII